MQERFTSGMHACITKYQYLSLLFVIFECDHHRRRDAADAAACGGGPRPPWAMVKATKLQDLQVLTFREKDKADDECHVHLILSNSTLEPSTIFRYPNYLNVTSGRKQYSPF
jgi:hypothetical protein